MPTSASLPSHRVGMMNLGALAEARASYNPRHITKAARERLRASLQRYGVASSLTWNQRTGRLVGGHQRVDVLLEDLSPDVEVPVVVVDLSDEDERALNVLLNRQDLAGDFDAEALAAVLRELEATAPALLDSLAFDEMPEARQSDVDRILAEITSEPEYTGAVTEDDRDALAERLAAHVRSLPLSRLDTALLVALPLRRGRDVLVLADPDTQDLVDEIQRAADSSDSPLERLFTALLASDPSPVVRFAQAEPHQDPDFST